MALKHKTSDANKDNAESRCQGLECLIRKKFGKNLKTVNLSIDELVPLGENFCSNMLKICAKVQHSQDSPIEEMHFVAKLILENSQLPLDWTGLFKKEIFMYTEIIPLFKKIELEHGVYENETIDNCMAKFCGQRMSLDPKRDVADKNTLILLENVKTQGYYVLDKKIGMDMEHALKAIKAIGRLHALGIIVKKKYPAEFETLKPQLLSIPFDVSILDELYEKFMDHIKKDSRFGKYLSCMEALVARMKGGLKYEEVTNEPWATVVHNDYWTNNIMFHKDEAGIIDGVKLVDFQAYSYVDMFVDLCYFFGTSLNDEVKFNRLDELLDAHYETFISTLKRMDMDVTDFSREKYDEQLKKDASYDFLHCTLALNFFTVDIDHEKEDRNSLIESLLTCKGNDLYSTKVLQLLEIYEKRDWLH